MSNPTTEEVIAYLKKAYPEAQSVNITVSAEHASVNVKYGKNNTGYISNATLGAGAILFS